MIKFEHNTLVLNSIFSKEDVKEIDTFADYIRNAEQERIIKLLEELDDDEWMGINQNFIALIKGENK
jgi:hypothetical protein